MSTFVSTAIYGVMVIALGGFLVSCGFFASSIFVLARHIERREGVFWIWVPPNELLDDEGLRAKRRWKGALAACAAFWTVGLLMMLLGYATGLFPQHAA